MAYPGTEQLQAFSTRGYEIAGKLGFEIGVDTNMSARHPYVEIDYSGISYTIYSANDLMTVITQPDKVSIVANEEPASENTDFPINFRSNFGEAEFTAQENKIIEETISIEGFALYCGRVSDLIAEDVVIVTENYSDLSYSTHLLPVSGISKIIKYSDRAREFFCDMACDNLGKYSVPLVSKNSQVFVDRPLNKDDIDSLTKYFKSQPHQLIFLD